MEREQNMVIQIKTYFDYCQGLRNCKRMHEKAWTHDPIIRSISEHVVCTACPYRYTNEAPPQLQTTVLSWTMGLCNKSQESAYTNLTIWLNSPNVVSCYNVLLFAIQWTCCTCALICIYVWSLKRLRKIWNAHQSQRVDQQGSKNNGKWKMMCLNFAGKVHLCGNKSLMRT